MAVTVDLYSFRVTVRYGGSTHLHGSTLEYRRVGPPRNRNRSRRVGVTRRRSNPNARGRAITIFKQIGVEDVFLDHRNPRGDVFEDDGAVDRSTTITIDEGVVLTVSDLVQARRRAEDAGIRLMGIHSLSYNVYGKIMLGTDGRDEQLETITRLIRNLGQSDIPILGYQWNPRGLVPMRTSRTERVRGGARASAFDVNDLADPHRPVETLEREYTEEELWENYEWFLERILPVAEEEDVRMAVHPTDPPTVEQLGGIPRLLRSFEAFKRAMELASSDAHGLKLCLGCFSEMPDTDVESVIRYFGERDEIVFVHFRDVIGTWPSFTETFIDDEASNFDELEAIRALEADGFDGVIVPDHTPSVVGDTHGDIALERTRRDTAWFGVRRGGTSSRLTTSAGVDCAIVSSQPLLLRPDELVDTPIAFDWLSLSKVTCDPTRSSSRRWTLTTDDRLSLPVFDGIPGGGRRVRPFTQVFHCPQ